jgi:RNA polymerase sigma-70 factor (ECF subfamily)
MRRPLVVLPIPRQHLSRTSPVPTADAIEKPAAEPGDPSQLHRLVVDHGDAVYRLALSVVRDKQLAEDIAQDTLMKAWLALPTLRDQGSIRGWVLRIAHNTSISSLRARRAIVVDPHELPESTVPADGSVEARVQSDAVVGEFLAALDTLDELSRSIVVLRELEGLTYDEIAEVLNVPLPTVKTRLLRARRRLGSTLREWA